MECRALGALHVRAHRLSHSLIKIFLDQAAIGDRVIVDAIGIGDLMGEVILSKHHRVLIDTDFDRVVVGQDGVDVI